MKFIFMGRKHYAAEMLEWLMQKKIDVVAVVTDSHIPNSPTMAVAKKYNLPLYDYEGMSEEVEKNSNFADYALSFLYWKKVKAPFLSSLKQGCINFHPALLPDYRGTAGYNVAILNKLQQWGTSAHFMAENIDEGDIIDVFRFHFDYRLETAQSLEEKTLRLQQDLFRSVVLDLLENKPLPRSPQKKEEGCYISKAEMLAMMKIDESMDDIDTKIQAFWFPPYSGAYVELQGKQYTVVNDFILESLAKENQTYEK